ncbi:hypothetical protein AVEN_265297-1 [Araneus ventricosus]|uniref:Uncharacterized protein n=1 Tax=Araneus ventricosus TaxID=182803 RepID=A0A4Y2ELM2_ARAVE|nr:hypothetical protein AVEN_265297-1 [Araneus ventricosus]
MWYGSLECGMLSGREAFVALVVRSSLWGRRVLGSRPGSRRSAVYGARYAKPYAVAKHPRECGCWRLGGQLRRRPRHLTEAQNYEVRPKIALVLLQNRTLI